MAYPPAATRPRSGFLAGILLPVVACLLLTAVPTLGLMLWSAAGVDERSLRRETDLAQNAISNQFTQTAHEQHSSTLWDDAVTHTKLNFDADWIDSNLGIWMWTVFGHDEVVILDAGNHPVYAMLAGKRIGLDHAEAELPALTPIVAELRRKIAAGGVDAFRTGAAASPPGAGDLAVINGIPSLVSMTPIISDTGTIHQDPGSEFVHVSMIHLDGDYAKRLSEQYFIPEAHFTQLGTTTDRAVLPITNGDGRFVTFFEWRKSSPGVAMLGESIPAVLAAFLIAGIVACILLSQLRRKSHALDANRAEAEHRAMHDHLTGLPNRMNFEASVARALAQRPSRDRQVSVLMLDLDRFKQVNDSLGHAAGDDLIEAVGQRLAELTGSTDRLARLGGDEFALLLVHLPDLGEPVLLSHGIIEALGKSFDVRGSEAFIGVSIGIATAEGDEVDPRELLRKADIALYEAKAGGRNRAVVFEETMSELLQSRHAIEGELRDALRRTDQLSVAYQPLFGPDHTTIIGAEALARWHHPQRGQVSPAHFIPVAEQSGLIEILGEFVLRRACELGAKWPGHTMAVNISPTQLRNPHFPSRVFALLKETGMLPADLELEITEGILLDDTSAPVETLRLFRAAGIRIALDDFGTGYSSLNYLKRYPVDRIKIDRAFVSQLAPGSVSVPIVQAMMTLAHALQIEVTAEGVETHQQVGVLTSLGCDVFQGFLLSAPITPEALETLLQLPLEAPRQIRVA